jgi:peptide/nickel transport system permease protein
MLRHIALRLAQSVLILLIMSFLVFGLISLMPGDPVSLMAAGSPGMTPEDVVRLKAFYGIDRPWTLRYGHWLGAALSGDLGYSRLSAQSVVRTLTRPLTNSLALMTCGLSLSLLLALPAGIFAALRRGRPLDHLLNLTAFAAISLPVFWLGLISIILFAVSLSWFPASGVETAGGGGGIDRLRHLVLPVLTLGVAGFGHYMRYMRAAMIGVLRQDWIRTARAKGLSWPQVVLRHALRNAMIPVVTVLSLDLGTLFSGIVVTETVFAYPGMGKLIYDAVMGADYNLALAGLLMATGLTLAGSLLADCAYGFLDPRIGER